MYKSPIEIELNDIVSDAVEKADELIKALEFDRGQYEKGWNDRDNEIVRCKDCRWYERKYPWNSHVYECSYLEYPMDDNGFCSWGERREDGSTGME